MIKGFVYLADNSEKKSAQLEINQEFYTLFVDDEMLEKGEILTLKISSRIGSLPRSIILNNGMNFVSTDNENIDSYLLKKKRSLLFLLETKLPFILLSLVVTVCFAFTFVNYGIPYISKKIAFSLPVDVNNTISQNSLEFLDEHIFEKTQLEEEKIASIKKMFNEEILPIIDSSKIFNYKLNFRLWKIKDENIANAFALPDGSIVVTDELVLLSKSNEELKSILLHEIGHVENKHGLENFISNSIVSILTMMVVGDASSYGDFGVGLGSFLLNSAYSREYESQADKFAYSKMLHNNIDPNNFATIMARITHQEKVSNKKDIMDYLSSHPNTTHRIDLANKYSICFKNGDFVCK